MLTWRQRSEKILRDGEPRGWKKSKGIKEATRENYEEMRRSVPKAADQANS
jgi:hypothetical protein